MERLKKVLLAFAFIYILISWNKAYASNYDSITSRHMELIADNNTDSNLKPVIDSISNLTIHLKEYDFSVEFDIFFHGTNHINVCLEEDLSSSLRDEYYEGDGFAHVKTGWMSLLVDCWVHIIASNEYGTVTKTLEFPQNFTNAVEDVAGNTYSFEINGQLLSIRCSQELNVAIFTFEGTNVYNNTISQDTDIPLESGTFIIRYGNSHGSRTKKIMIR